jgi:hypothetical protein
LRGDIFTLSGWLEEHGQKAIQEALAGRSGAPAHRIEEYYIDMLHRRISELRYLLADLEVG